MDGRLITVFRNKVVTAFASSVYITKPFICEVQNTLTHGLEKKNIFMMAGSK